MFLLITFSVFFQFSGNGSFCFSFSVEKYKKLLWYLLESEPNKHVFLCLENMISNHNNLTFTKKLLVFANGIGYCTSPYCNLYIFRLILQLYSRPWQSSQFYLLIWRRDLMERLCLMLTSILRRYNLWHPFYDDVPLLVFVASHYGAVLCRRVPRHSFSSFVTLYFFVISVLLAEHTLVDTFKRRS